MSAPLTILITDDQPIEHVLYEDYLNDDTLHRYHFLHAYSGDEAEKLCKQHPIDCVLLDYHLPDTDGLHVLKCLLAHKPGLPIIMLTGEGSETTAVIAMKNGAQDYLPKRAITPTALQRCVERAIERSKLLQRMETYRSDLERSNKDLERFATVVAHDLKSPLRAITQHLELIQNNKNNVLEERSLKSMKFVMNGAGRMRELIDALLEYSHLGFSEKMLAPVDCNHVLAMARANLSAIIAEKGAHITADALPTLMADKIQMVQLFQNLIANALKFCTAAPSIHIAVTQQNGQWAFAFRDNGIGIAAHNLEKVFLIFKRVYSEDEYPGAGIGLAICDRVVRNHHGTIWVESEIGKGATFFFTLPIPSNVA